MEWSRGARCAAAFGGVVAAAVLSTTAWQPASAVPGPPAENPAAENPAAEAPASAGLSTALSDPVLAVQAAALPSGLKQAVRRDLGITPHEYLARARAAQAVADEAARLRRQDPDSFGAAWLTPAGTPTIAVTDAQAAQTVRKAGFTPAEVAAARKDTAPSVASPHTAAPRPMRFTSTMAGDEFLTGAGPAEQWTEYRSCSFGFTAFDAAGDPFALTAGHCDPSPRATGGPGAAGVHLRDGQSWRDGTRVGHFAESTVGQAPGYLDYAMVTLDPGAPTGLGTPQVRGEDGAAVTITGMAEPVAGADVCKFGEKSGFTCGTITAPEATVVVEDDQGDEVGRVSGFTTTVCTLTGDSGGPMLTGTRALGIVSASGFDPTQGCPAGLTSEDGPQSLGVPVGTILADADMDLTLRTVSDPGAPIPGGGDEGDGDDGDGDGGAPGMPAGSLGSLSGS